MELLDQVPRLLEAPLVLGGCHVWGFKNSCPPPLGRTHL